MKGILPNQHLVTMQKLVELVPPPTDFVFSPMFPEEKWASDQVKWEVAYDAGGMTPFVAPGTPAPTVGMDTIGQKNAQVAFWKEKTYFDESVLNNLREPGTWQDKQTAERTLAKQTIKLTKRCQMRQEWMCCKAITTGALAYQNNKGVKFNVNYMIPSANQVTLSGNYVWGTGSSRDPKSDIVNAKLALQMNYGVSVTKCIMNSFTMKTLMLDATVMQPTLQKLNYGTGDLFRDPAGALGDLFNVGPLNLYDGMYEIPLDIIGNIAAGASTVTVADPSDVEVNGRIRLWSGLVDNTWEDFSISAVNKLTGVITLAAVPAGATGATGNATTQNAYIMGRDSASMKKKLVPDGLVILLADTVDGTPIGNFALAPHSLKGDYGMQFYDWADDDPEGLYVKVQNKGLPMLYHPEAIYLLQAFTSFS